MLTCSLRSLPPRYNLRPSSSLRFAGLAALVVQDGGRAAAYAGTGSRSGSRLVLGLGNRLGAQVQRTLGQQGAAASPARLHHPVDLVELQQPDAHRGGGEDHGTLPVGRVHGAAGADHHRPEQGLAQRRDARAALRATAALAAAAHRDVDRHAPGPRPARGVRRRAGCPGRRRPSAAVRPRWGSAGRGRAGATRPGCASASRPALGAPPRAADQVGADQVSCRDSPSITRRP